MLGNQVAETTAGRHDWLRGGDASSADERALQSHMPMRWNE
jgi:hypothetical protein